MKKEFDILKKPYLPPRVEFEEIEIDEMEMLLAGSDTTGGGGGYDDDPDNSDDDPDALSVDFVMNDVELNWEQ